MFLSKIKILSVLVIGVLLGLGTGIFGMPAVFTPAVHAAMDADQPAQNADDPEPLDGQLLLNVQVQKELRLSQKQIGRINAVSQEVDVKSESKRKEIKALQKQIEELQKRIGELAENVNKVNMQIEDQRAKTLGKAAPDILSDKAVTRLRHIQRQKRSLNELLTDASIQRMLKLDDEQIRKIELILKTDNIRTRVHIRQDGSVGFWNSATGSAYWIDTSESYSTTAEAAYLALATGHYSWNAPTLQKLFDVLNPTQQRSLIDWLGEPYEGTSWHALRGKAK